MTVELLRVEPLQLRDALVVLSTFGNDWGDECAEGMVLRSAPSAIVHRILVRRSGQLTNDDPAIMEAMDVRAYALEWCKAKLEESLLSWHESHASATGLPAAVSLIEADLAYLYRRWRVGEAELALRSAASRTASAETSQLLARALRLRGIEVDVDELPRAGA